MNRRVIATASWPWDRDKKNVDDVPKAKVKSKIGNTMKLKPVSVPKRLKPITDIVRKPNGEVNESAVKNLIHSLESLLPEQK